MFHKICSCFTLSWIHTVSDFLCEKCLTCLQLEVCVRNYQQYAKTASRLVAKILCFWAASKLACKISRQRGRVEASCLLKNVCIVIQMLSSYCKTQFQKKKTYLFKSNIDFNWPSELKFGIKIKTQFKNTEIMLF